MRPSTEYPSFHAANGAQGNPSSEQICPCCDNDLDRIKRNLANVSRLAVMPLPAAAGPKTHEALGRVRDAGREMLLGLAESMRTQSRPPYPERFERCIADFIREAGQDEWLDGGVEQLYALQAALIELARSVGIFAEELGRNAESAQPARALRPRSGKVAAGSKSGGPYYCDPVVS